MNWNDLLIEILNMTKEEREQEIGISNSEYSADLDDYVKAERIYKPKYINPSYNRTSYLIVDAQ